MAKTVGAEYTIIELGGGLISKGQALRYFELKHPEYVSCVVKAFKIDHEAKSVSVKIQVQPKAIGMTGANGSGISGELLLENEKLKKQIAAFADTAVETLEDEGDDVESQDA